MHKVLRFPCYLTLFLFWQLIISSAKADEAGYSNPDGYMVNVYYQYAECKGEITAKIATALGVCINSGMMGTPYIYTPTIYTLDNNGNITATCYQDSECTLFPVTATLGGCAQAGNAIYTSYSATLPSLVVDDPILEQVQYDYNYSSTGTEGGETYAADDDECVSGDFVTLYNAVYRDTCQFDCGEGDWSCQITSCHNGTANVTFSVSNVDDADDNGACSASTVGTTLLTTSCSQKIVCFELITDDETSSPNSDSDHELGEVVVASISIAAALAAIAVCIGVYWWKFHKPTNSDSPDDDKSTLHTAFNP